MSSVLFLALLVHKMHNPHSYVINICLCEGEKLLHGNVSSIQAHCATGNCTHETQQSLYSSLNTLQSIRVLSSTASSKSDDATSSGRSSESLHAVPGNRLFWVRMAEGESNVGCAMPAQASRSSASSTYPYPQKPKATDQNSTLRVEMNGLDSGSKPTTPRPATFTGSPSHGSGPSAPLQPMTLSTWRSGDHSSQVSPPR